MPAQYSYFAFLDVMGYRAHLSNDKRNGTELFKEKLTSAYRIFDQINIANLHHKSISDSIFISSSNNVVEFLKAIKNVYISFLENGLLIRGGIAYNQHFETAHITYSHALSDAYIIESQKSLFPRVIIDQSVIQKLANEAENNNSTELADIKSESLILECGNHYQLHIIDQGNWTNLYEQAKKIYTDSEQEIKNNPKLYEYYLWLQNYIFHFSPPRNRRQKFMESFNLPP